MYLNFKVTPSPENTERAKPTVLTFKQLTEKEGTYMFIIPFRLKIANHGRLLHNLASRMPRAHLMLSRHAGLDLPVVGVSHGGPLCYVKFAPPNLHQALEKSRK